MSKRWPIKGEYIRIPATEHKPHDVAGVVERIYSKTERGEKRIILASVGQVIARRSEIEIVRLRPSSVLALEA